MSAKRSQAERQEPDEPLPNPAVEEFFSKMNRDMRRPKPSEEAVAKALQAIQTLAADVALQETLTPEAVSGSATEPATTPEQAACPKCGGLVSENNRFCGFCGTLLDKPGRSATKPVTAIAVPAAEQHIHHHHHHYHHFPEQDSGTAESPASPQPVPVVGLEPAEIASAEAALRKLMQRWTMAYNSKRLDEVASLYSNDAIVLRPNTLPVRGRAGVREHLSGSMQSGLGDMQVDCTDVGVLGEIACLSGRNRMLMPVAAGNRQERTGKFLVVARREGTEWKILADVWCMDMPPAPPPRAPRKISGLDT